MFRAVALWLITIYQRHLSPYKGYGCAYRVHTGHASCSALGYRAIRRYGVRGGLSVLDRRLQRCGIAAGQRRALPRPTLHRQAGLCDIGCDGCDAMPGCDDVMDCPCDCCDWRKRRKDSKDKKRSYLPPNRWSQR